MKRTLVVELDGFTIRVRIIKRFTCPHITALTEEAQEELDEKGCPICAKEKQICYICEEEIEEKDNTIALDKNGWAHSSCLIEKNATKQTKDTID